MLTPLQLYLLCVAISGCGFVAQTLISGFWSTAFNEDSIYYSVNLAFYFGGMGVGALVASWKKKPSEMLVLGLVLALAALVAVMIPVLRVGVSWLGNREFMPLTFVVLAGLLAGASMPLMLKLRTSDGSVRLGTLFLLDYGSAFFFALAFNLILLPKLGYQQTAIFCFGAAALMSARAVLTLTGTRGLIALGVMVTVVSVSSRPLSRFAMNPGRETASEFRVLLDHQSHYQKIVMTEELGRGSFYPNQMHRVFYLDGMVQFSSLDETTYHLCLANIPLTATEFFGGKPRTGLILGGGDGLAARNLLAYRTMEKVTQVELDPAVMILAKHNPHLKKLNADVYSDKRFHPIVGDAFQWIRHSQEKFDVVLLDFPHPKNLSLARLYSAEFYSQLKERLKPGGFIAIQSGPALSAQDIERLTLTEVSTSILETVRRAGLKAEIYMSPGDQEAFILATQREDFDMAKFARSMGLSNPQGMGMICQYRPDWKRPEVKINTLNDLALVNYMDRWNRGGARKNYDFRGVRSVFLPQ